MAYSYYPYQPNYFQPPMPDQLTQLRQQQYQPMQQMTQQQAPPSIVWVQSEMEAANYLVAPNSAVTLWDSNAPVVYLKQADASGKPTMKIYDLVERTKANRSPTAASMHPAMEYVTRDEFNALAARLDAITSPKTTSKKSTPMEDVE